ncbi:MAG TPA: DeoR/GlpR transcriptional regulator [Chloroflexi bacterium]|nr:DeoR/GlpR transcriptional regulator [Chloroflexota bacterium]
METGRGTVQRRAEIARLLAQTGAVEVASLVARFGVTAPTIRRDLAWLTEQGLARRVRGGALAVGEGASTASPDAVPVRIGRAVAGLVQDGETVFLSPGPLAVETARALAGRERLTVVTNGLTVARQVAECTSHTLILTGGQLERGRHGLVGHLARAALEGLRADRVLLELSGVSAVDGLTDDSLPQAELARVLLDLNVQIVVLVAPERVGRVAAAYIGPASEADAVVTGREADSAPLWDLAESGVRVVLA